jgi:hypothetical protein
VRADPIVLKFTQDVELNIVLVNVLAEHINAAMIPHFVGNVYPQMRVVGFGIRSPVRAFNFPS